MAQSCVPGRLLEIECFPSRLNQLASCYEALHSRGLFQVILFIGEGNAQKESSRIILRLFL